MTTKKNNNTEWDKCFSFEEVFQKIGLILDRELAGVNNSIIRDLAGMNAIISIRDVLCGKVITSFTPILGIEQD